MRQTISRIIVLFVFFVLVACGGGTEMEEDVSVPESPIELNEGERILLPGSGPTEESPVMTLNVYITDAQSGEPVAAEIWLNESLAGSGKSIYTVFLPAQFEGILSVKAKGYNDFSTGMQYTIKRSRTMDAPVRLERALGEEI